MESVEDTRTAITFITEPIFASLSNVLGNRTNLPLASRELDAFSLDEIEMQRGLLQIDKALAFCHDDAKLIHGNLVPEAIYINHKGDWKVAGFGFSIFAQYKDNRSFFEYPEYDIQVVTMSRPLSSENRRFAVGLAEESKDDTTLSSLP